MPRKDFTRPGSPVDRKLAEGLVGPAAKPDGSATSPSEPIQPNPSPVATPTPQATPPHRAEPASTSAAVPSKKLAYREKRMTIESEALRAAEQMVRRIGDEIDVPNLAFSACARALFALLLERRDALGGVPAPRLKRPRTDDPEALAQFDRELTEYLRVLMARGGR